MKIVTVTLNPALDLTGQLGVAELGEVNLIQQAALGAAGKGVNVARVLADLSEEDHQVIATGMMGAENDELFRQLFACNNIQDEFVRVKGANRINVKLAEADGRVSDFNFPGLEVDAAAIEAFTQKLLALCEQADTFVIAGSLPRGISTEQLTRWLQVLKEQGKKVLFDSSGAAFDQGIKVGPSLIKPNIDELQHWVGRPLDSREEVAAVARQLLDSGIENVVVSMGKDGTLWFNKQGVWHAQPPKMQVVSTVGAGDTLVAACAWGLANQWPAAQIVKFGTALSALAVTQVGVGLQDKQALADVMGQVTVTEA